MPDLIDLSTLQIILAGGGVNLTPLQVAASAPLIDAASRMVRKHCNRYFSRAIFDGLYTVDTPSKFVLTREYPLNSVIRAATNPTVVLSINNSNSSVQRAYSILEMDGALTDPVDLPSPVKGIKCVRISNGAATTSSLAFSSYGTVQSLANAVNALGNGWAASVTPGYEGWPTVDPESATPLPPYTTSLSYFHPLQGAIPAKGQTSAGFIMHVDDLFVQIRSDTGDINLASATENDPFQSLKFGGYLSTDIGDISDFGGYQGLRLIYDAGVDVMYEDIQVAVAETVNYWLTEVGLDQTVTEESIGSYSYKLAADSIAKHGMPGSAVSKLSYYRNNRC